MRLVDANVLLHAVNEGSSQHETARRWLDGSLAGRDRVGFAWLVLTAFLRLSTHSSVFARPLSTDQAIGVASEWTAAQNAVIVTPGPTHLAVLQQLLRGTGTGGNLVNDAHLAALALEHRADVVSYDNDFTRFAGVRWFRPDDLLETDC